MKKKSIVMQQILFYGSTILVCILMLWGILTTIYTNHYMEDKQIELIEQGKKISTAFSSVYLTGDLTTLSFELQVLEEYMEAKVLMVDKQNVVVLVSPGTGNILVGDQFVYPVLNQGVLEGNIIVGEAPPKSGGFSVDTLVVGYPMSTGDITGIFMCHPLPTINQSLKEIYNAGMTGSLGVFIIGIIISYFTSKRISKPLKEMNQVAKIISGGNYNERVEISGQDEVGQLGESFNEMAESIQNNDKIRRDFIANVSHDLRSPLTSMQGFLTAMLDGTIPIEKQEKYLNIVLEETNRLSRIAESISDLSQAQNTTKLTLNITKFDINMLIRSLVTIMEPQIKEKNINIKGIYTDKPINISGDKDKISRVFQNLLNNAIKFTGEGKSIEAQVKVVKNKKVLVSVKDEGIGISENDQKYIFERFYKADATRNEVKEGSGLGLAIAREFLFAHGEELKVESQLGVGTTFTFSLRICDEK